MAKMKAYTLGNHGFISSEVRDALGLPRHIRQASVLLVAATKTAAVQVAAERGIRAEARDPEFRVTDGPQVRALAEAGLLNEPGVLVTPGVGSGGNSGVVRVDPGAPPVLVGRFDGYGTDARFVPEGE